jgi:hypothetical protein
MYILVKLNPNQGADLGPNFTLTANVGTLVPATATLSELLVGVTVLADNAATQVFITSQGICTNTLTIAISPATTTTTTSSGTTTTTTTSGTTTTTTSSGTTTTTAPYVLYSNRFVFSNTGSPDICILSTVPAYGLPLYIFTPPPNLYQDAYGTIPFPNSNVLDVVFPSGGSNSVYSYNSATGAVGAASGSCLS